VNHFAAHDRAAAAQPDLCLEFYFPYRGFYLGAACIMIAEGGL
jgi:hypothetical protein